MAKFVLLLRDSGSFPGDMSPQEIQAVFQRYQAWSEKLGRNMGEKLRDGEGRVVVRSGKKTSITDGPYVESKEVLGGLYIIEATSYEDAVRKCQDSPHLDFGSIEVRQIEEM
jgi:hypothetical protein